MQISDEVLNFGSLDLVKIAEVWYLCNCISTEHSSGVLSDT